MYNGLDRKIMFDDVKLDQTKTSYRRFAINNVKNVAYT